VTGTSKH